MEERGVGYFNYFNFFIFMFIIFGDVLLLKERRGGKWGVGLF
jgi:hypothetical protein